MNKRSQRDNDWIDYLARETIWVSLKYIVHPRKGTILNVYIADRGAEYIPFVIANLPVHIDKVYRRVK